MYYVSIFILVIYGYAFVYYEGNPLSDANDHLLYSVRCDRNTYTLTVQYEQLEDPADNVRHFSLSPYNRPDCRNQRTGANTTHEWLTVRYVGDCGVSIEVRIISELLNSELYSSDC